jgi:cytochrome c biogenesis protein CcdA
MSTSSAKSQSGAKRRMNSYAAKVMALGVGIKAVIMGTVVTILAATTFLQSVLLVLISATATGVFGLVIVLIQNHAEQRFHRRIDYLEQKADKIDTTTTETKEKAEEVAGVIKP